MSKKSSEPAFPWLAPTIKERHQGMTLRDYMAAKAMQGMLASDHKVHSLVAGEAYRMADLMIEARKS